MKTLLVGGGLVLLLAGAIFTLQGLGDIGGNNAMSGKTLWAVVGPVIALVGVVTAFIGVRAGRLGHADQSR
ncbi:MAG TPA: hypothetical protein VH021_09935 [Trebonia sp.]|jgi:hypothetical protein|nr:hypothetical protein [Trebonia sp.]